MRHVLGGSAVSVLSLAAVIGLGSPARADVVSPATPPPPGPVQALLDAATAVAGVVVATAGEAPSLVCAATGGILLC